MELREVAAIELAALTGARRSAEHAERRSRLEAQSHRMRPA